MSYKSSGRSVCDLKAHLVLVTKYRRKVISPAMLERLAQLMQHICQKWGCQCIEFNGEADHVHLLFSYYPQMQLSKFINSLKSYTSQTIRKEFPCEVKRVYWGKPVFWTSSYFIASCGGVTVEVLKPTSKNRVNLLSPHGACQAQGHLAPSPDRAFIPAPPEGRGGSSRSKR